MHKTEFHPQKKRAVFLSAVFDCSTEEGLLKLKNGTAAEKTDGELKEFLQYMSRNKLLCDIYEKDKGKGK
ncbi:hypothetical protein [Treponema pedis]|uniref:hypothetical protein n=1 Tax=Treponema pedis TaxID=409322 RepID=UPI000464D16D|nr:hypothetical protein [Treponema pedis]